MPLPTLTDDDRNAARRKAILVRQARSAVRASLKAGTLTLPQALNRSDTVVGRMPVRQLLTALPGIGQVRAERSMKALGIPERRRVQGLGPHPACQAPARVPGRRIDHLPGGRRGAGRSQLRAGSLPTAVLMWRSTRAGAPTSITATLPLRTAIVLRTCAPEGSSIVDV